MVLKRTPKLASKQNMLVFKQYKKLGKEITAGNPELISFRLHSKQVNFHHAELEHGPEVVF